MAVEVPEGEIEPDSEQEYGDEGVTNLKAYMQRAFSSYFAKQDAGNRHHIENCEGYVTSWILLNADRVRSFAREGCNGSQVLDINTSVDGVPVHLGVLLKTPDNALTVISQEFVFSLPQMVICNDTCIRVPFMSDAPQLAIAEHRMAEFTTQ